ncbi:glycoside hydrolase family 65 protein [Lacimicrobium alkaliphilum]|uniref:Glycosyl hydrolase n=1 Tax=Lacimicrobium alkaliphilum TaxID=1526571 RepID=A0ABQ1QZU5_9ALTE|nr:glycosyl hydrolase family 65 protein [Lacimicrobium alkaliphilum]GGD50355.1 glycosyl hydrolase [Lacimicrobium alkaliphilum]
MQPIGSDYLFAPEPWQLTNTQTDSNHNMLEETLFALANGYLGTRGTLEEGHEGKGTSCEGTYLNGVYHSEPITYGEVAYGYASHNQKMLQVPNGKAMQFSLDGQRISLNSAQSGRRWLNFKDASYNRDMRWQSDSGKRLSLISRRFASLAHPNLLALRTTITAENFCGRICLSSAVDADYSFSANKADPRAGQLNMADSLRLQKSTIENEQIQLLHEVNNSPFAIGTSVCHQLSHTPLSVRESHSDSCPALEYEFELQQGETLIIDKYVLYRHNSDKDFAAIENALTQDLQQINSLGWQSLLDQHSSKITDFWRSSDVEIEGDEGLQQGIRFNLLHLFMSAGKDGHSNMGAKGLTGHGYDGHYFWDTEIYILSFLSATNPDIARKCLEFRYHTLEGARKRARQMSHKTGALYPWRTIGGDECSAFFPAGTAQYHINAAIAHALRHYYQASGDWQFIQDFGAEMLFETARLWLDLGHFNARKDGQFCIDGVTGPDEYTAIVNNNFYTNAMARAHLQFAVQVADKMQQDCSEVFASLCNKLALNTEEISDWRQAGEKMYLPYDNNLGISKQDDSFLDKKTWDFANTPADHYPLLLHYHPLVIYRHQVLKQADVVLTMYLLDDAFSKDLKKRNLDYYEPLTTHDSTLSSCIHSIEFAETGQYERAYEFFKDTVRMDIDNRHGNTEYGIHTACMAGSWMGIVNGFGGLRIRDQQLHFEPHLPANWQGFSFHLNCLGRRLKISVGRQHCQYRLLEGERISIFHHGQTIELALQQSIEVKTQTEKQP